MLVATDYSIDLDFSRERNAPVRLLRLANGIVMLTQFRLSHHLAPFSTIVHTTQRIDMLYSMYDIMRNSSVSSIYLSKYSNVWQSRDIGLNPYMRKVYLIIE